MSDERSDYKIVSKISDHIFHGLHKISVLVATQFLPECPEFPVLKIYFCPLGDCPLCSWGVSVGG